MPVNIQLLKKTILTVLVTSAFGLTAGTALAADANSANDSCLGCHADMDIVGEDRLIHNDLYHNTTHSSFGCTACHNNVPDSHPDGQPIAFTTACNSCHADVADQYTVSKHFIGTPDCGSCHNPHTAQKAEKMSAVEMNAICTNCHDHMKITASHAQWLPQTGLHLGAITCVTCHTETDSYVLSVYMARKDLKGSATRPVIADYNYLLNKAGNEEIQQLVDTNHDAYISLEELRKFNSNPENKDVFLKAILTPTHTSHAFHISDKSFNCTFCHASGPNSAQITKLVLPEKDGSYRQLDIESGGTIGSLNAIPDFYMMGTSRNSLMNKLGAVILAGGLVMPVGHGLIRFMTRKNRERNN